MNPTTNPIMEASEAASKLSTISPDPDAPLPFEQLTADEIQEIRRTMEQNRLERARTFTVPELPISEPDKDRFADCLLSGQPYTESFERFKGKLKVVLRSRFKWEEDAIIDQVFQDFAEKQIKSDGQYVNRLNVYNLSFQVSSLDGVVQITSKKSENLREHVQKGIFEDMPEPKLYILVSLLHQFDTKVTALCRMALPDFSEPDADS
jgi:hypothetical protein